MSEENRSGTNEVIKTLISTFLPALIVTACVVLIYGACTEYYAYQSILSRYAAVNEVPYSNDVELMEHLYGSIYLFALAIIIGIGAIVISVGCMVKKEVSKVGEKILLIVRDNENLRKDFCSIIEDVSLMTTEMDQMSEKVETMVQMVSQFIEDNDNLFNQDDPDD